MGGRAPVIVIAWPVKVWISAFCKLILQVIFSQAVDGDVVERLVLARGLFVRHSGWHARLTAYATEA